VDKNTLENLDGQPEGKTLNYKSSNKTCRLCKYSEFGRNPELCGHPSVCVCAYYEYCKFKVDWNGRCDYWEGE